jgi:hypothetical protein
MEEEVPVLSYAFDSKSVATARHAAHVHERSLGILQQLFNNRFRFASIHDLGIDYVVICIVSAAHATVAKAGWIFARRAVAFARLGVNENRATLRIRMTRWNCGVGKRMTRSPGWAQRKQCRHGNPFGESAMTTPWSGAPASAARRAASATSVASGTIWKFKVFMSTAKCIASIRASTKFGQGIL